MSAPVDVLAVMGDVRSAAGDYDADRLHGIAAGDVFDEARAAVAELIAAAKLSVQLGRVSENLAAALARVNGGQP